MVDGLAIDVESEVPDELQLARKRTELKRLLEEKKRRQAVSLAEFIRQAWPIIEPATELLWNWHIDVICDDLEVISDALDKKNPAPLEPIRETVNMPPRYMKSNIITVMWPVWEWGPRGLPWSRFLFGSYAEKLSTKHSVDRRTIIESRWYQERWGHVFRLSSDQNVKTEFTNNHRGLMLATSINGGKLGRGGHRVVIDDPHDPEKVLSDDIRATDVRRFKQGYSTRLDDKRRGAIVVVMQRLHENDLSAHTEGLGYRKLMLDNPCQEDTVIETRKGRRIERKVGELLWPEREGEQQIAQARKELGPYGFAGQYLQRPSPIGGVIFQRHHWKFYKELPATVDGKAQSIDCAFKGTDESDFVACMVGSFKGANTYIEELIVERLTFNGTKEMIRSQRAKHPDATHIYVEDKANGPAVIDDLKDSIPGLIAVNPEGGKLARAHKASGDVEAGNVWLPVYLDDQGNVIPGREWVFDFIDHAAKFPKIANDDDIDAFTQLIVARRNSAFAILDFMRQEAERHAGRAEPQPDPAPATAPVVEPTPVTVVAAKLLFG